MSSCATSSTVTTCAAGGSSVTLGAALPIVFLHHHLRDSAFQQAEEEGFHQLRGKYNIAPCVKCSATARRSS